MLVLPPRMNVDGETRAGTARDFAYADLISDRMSDVGR
jgi:hypothetical protein